MLLGWHLLLSLTSEDPSLLQLLEFITPKDHWRTTGVPLDLYKPENETVITGLVNYIKRVDRDKRGRHYAKRMAVCLLNYSRWVLKTTEAACTHLLIALVSGPF